jgi:hypothetical protein
MKKQKVLKCIREYCDEHPVGGMPTHLLQYMLDVDSHSRYTEYLVKIHELKDRGYITENVEHYEITPDGRDYLWRVSLSNIIITLATVVVAVLVMMRVFPELDVKKIAIKPNSTTITEITLSKAVAANKSPVKTIPITDWFPQVPGNLDVVDINQNSITIETESSNSNTPNAIFIPVKVRGAKKLHILMNMTYGKSIINNQPLHGVTICQVGLHSGNLVHKFDLRAGHDIREWVVESTGTVNTVGDHVKPAWENYHRATNRKAVIDHITLEIPENWTDRDIDYISIEDRSWDELSDKDPGILLFGIAFK